jgi:phosphatidylglycerol---prolipoprotein diacylglyceryl transferase
MRPVLLTWNGHKVYSYPAMLYLGLVVGVLAGRAAAAASSLDPNRTEAAILLLLVPALVGARAWFVIGHWPVYLRDPRRIWRRSEGGAAMYGGLVLAVLASLALLPTLGLPFGSFWDAAAITMLLGMVFTRVGCLLTGCCAGRPMEGRFAMRLPDATGIRRRRVPTQLLEGGAGLALLVGALALRDVTPFPGALFLYTVGGYGLARLLIEPTREAQDRVGRFPVASLVSAILVVSCLLAFLFEATT